MVLVPHAQIPSTEPEVPLKVDYWWPTACLQLQRIAFSWARITLLSPSPPQPLLRGTCSQWLTERQVQKVSPWFQDGRKYVVQFTLQSSAWTHIEANLQMRPCPCFPSRFPLSLLLRAVHSSITCASILVLDCTLANPTEDPWLVLNESTTKAMELAWFTSGSATQVGTESLSADIYTTVERKHQAKLPLRRKKKKTWILVRQSIQQRHSSK